MAKKGQKFDSYTEEFKLKLYYEYKNGDLGGYRQVAKKYNISPKTYYKYRNKEDPDYYDCLLLKTMQLLLAIKTKFCI